MRVLVFNAGSSSLKVALFDGDTTVMKLGFERFSPEGCTLARALDEGKGLKSRHSARTLAEAVACVPALIEDADLAPPEAVGHRIAHGGDLFEGPALLDAPTLARIATLNALAPVHNPVNLATVATAMQVWPGVPHLGVFDTAFHRTMPARASTYALPESWRKAGVRRYGFHGTSHEYVALRAAQALGRPLRDLRVISLHLGNGASACAIAHGRSIDTSMGMTPLEGLVMGTRPGDLDAGALAFVMREMGLTMAEVEAALNAQSGLQGLTGLSDMREIEERAAEGDGAAQAAITLSAYRARKYLGAYAAAMGGVDAVVFTGGIGENSASMRQRICEGLEFLGLRLDLKRNAAPDLSQRAAPMIHDDSSRVAVLVTQTAEALQIAREVAGMLSGALPADEAEVQTPSQNPAAAPHKAGRLPIPVAVSGRHVHLCAEAVAALFGPGHTLTPAQPLRQPGHWLALERLALEGPRGRMENLAILAPLRARTQIEVSRTDTFALGVDAPLRDSGQLEGTPRVRLIGPAGMFETDGLIVAARHIHINPAEAEARALTDGDMVPVRIDAPNGRGLTFDHVLVRVGKGAFTEMHIDTDEANAAGISGAAEGAVLGDVTAQLG